MKRIVFATLVAAAALPLAAQAANTPRIDQREANIDKMEAKAKSDGKVTQKERKKITKAQDKESRKTYKEKHDKPITPKA